MHETESRPRWIVPMRPRSPDEAHRSATPLELLFDLVFVVAVAQAAAALHHGIAEGHAPEVLVSYILVFFGVWWAWTSFTWFASSYDNDDIPYRLLTFVQMTGALIIASGVGRVFAERDLTITVIGYVVMRVAAVAQWMRAARADPEHRTATLRYGIGIALVQVAWVFLLALPKDLHLPLFGVLVVIEILIPIWAERGSPTAWHVHHIHERHGLFTLIVLGESILSTSAAIETTLSEGIMNGDLVATIFGALLIVYALWWLYFYQPLRRDLLTSLRVGFTWAYGHLFIFASIAAVGTGLAVVVDQVTHHTEISMTAAGMAVAIPSALYVITLWALQEHMRVENRFDTLLHPVTALLILLTPFTGNAVLLTGILLSILVIIRLIRHLE
jgi:low temperature requirement protein LtrA